MNNKKIADEIQKLVDGICKKHINMTDDNIFSYRIGVSPRELVYIFLEIEKIYSIDIDELVRALGPKITLNKIVDNVQKLIIKKDEKKKSCNT